MGDDRDDPGLARAAVHRLATAARHPRRSPRRACRRDLTRSRVRDRGAARGPRLAARASGGHRPRSRLAPRLRHRRSRGRRDQGHDRRRRDLPAVRLLQARHARLPRVALEPWRARRLGPVGVHQRHVRPRVLVARTGRRGHRAQRHPSHVLDLQGRGDVEDAGGHGRHDLRAALPRPRAARRHVRVLPARRQARAVRGQAARRDDHDRPAGDGRRHVRPAGARRGPPVLAEHAMPRPARPGRRAARIGLRISRTGGRRGRTRCRRACCATAPTSTR